MNNSENEFEVIANDLRHAHVCDFALFSGENFPVSCCNKS